jgi:hypothetical protein
MREDASFGLPRMPPRREDAQAERDASVRERDLIEGIDKTTLNPLRAGDRGAFQHGREQRPNLVEIDLDERQAASVWVRHSTAFQKDNY